MQRLGAENAYFAEFFAVILAVKIAFSMGWTRIWFEMDSALTLMNFFKPDYILPWKLRRRWERCLSMLERMEFQASHIYREGNVPADILSNVALAHSEFTWWCS